MPTLYLFVLSLLSPVFCQQYCTSWVAVKPGDSCWGIAESIRSTVNHLISFNPGINCDSLWVGQQICTATSSSRPACTRTYRVSSGDYCYKVWTDNFLSEKQLMDMNPNLDCNRLSVGQEICISVDPRYSTRSQFTTTSAPRTTTPFRPIQTTQSSFQGVIDEHPPLPLVESEQRCYEFVTVQKGESCFHIANAYNLNITTMQKTYDCTKLKTGDTVCVALNYTCQLRHKVEKDDTCQSLDRIYKMNSSEIERNNLGVSCGKLPVGRMLCVWPVYERALVNMTCKLYNTLENDANCYDISSRASLTIDEFRFLNPYQNCDKGLKKGTKVCIAGQNTPKCASIQNVPAKLTCGEMAQSFSMSDQLLMRLNPTLNCDRLRDTEQVCIGQGFFKASECTEAVRITPDFDTCQKVMEQSGLTLEQVKSMNPTINCGSIHLNWGILVCTTSLGMDTRTAQEIVISNLKSLEPQLGKKYEEYLKNPSEQNANVMNQLMNTAILKPAVHSRLKDLYWADVNFRKIIDSQHPLPRQTYCNQAWYSTTTDAIKACFCSNDYLLIYCQALAIQRFQENEARAYQNVTSRQKRKLPCSFTFPGAGQGILDKMTSSGSTCFGGGCAVPFGLVEIGIDSSICTPIINILEDTIRFCTSDGHDCNSANADRPDELKFLAERGVGGKFKMCAIGSNLIQKLTSADAGLCWDIVAADYYGFVGKLNIGSTLQLIVFKLTGGATMKVHDLPYPQMCERSEIECEDYCKWQDWDNGRAYGYIGMHFLAIFGWDGIKVFDEKIHEPRGLGCQAGREAAVVLRQERTCKDPNERPVWRCCWSGGKDNKCTFELMEYDKGFHFGPAKWTVFTCEFIEKDLDHGQKLGFDVYGGKSKNEGKKSFYYVVKNDGIYFGKEKYKEDQLVKAWDNPCKGEEEEKRNERRREPSGQSSVPANGCGKRIVGYYTGWGDREITENQLRKLTHVIFAFVAMYPDGGVNFGPVSEDDSGPEAGVKAKRRFMDLRDKARRVNSGVHILFAVGGWDNSQYFASVAADPGKRRNFINQIVMFITDHGIDGVDLDWEYPDMKGADKNNHVTLMREIRERLDSLQREKGRNSRYLLTLATAAGEWNLREGYDLNGILRYADFINVMTYDYYGAWRSKWGAYTGTPAPLYFGSLKGFSGKLNADFTMKFYTCKTKQPSKLNMGVPFYGRFWRNVQGPIDASDEMWRTAQEVGGIFDGGYVAWRNLEKEGWNKGAASWHDKTKTPYILNSGARMFMGFENERSLREKINYATDRNLGGLMIWALDLDDDADTLLNLVSSAGLCSGGSGDNIKYTCVPIDDVRWWTPENSDESRQGQCGKSAPLINGYYPVCDPDDPGFSCCGAAGYCGSEKEYCDCESCIDYRKDPMAIVKEPTKPTRAIQWYVMSDPDGKRGRCGKDVPPINGQMAICNPDDNSKHCCSNGGYCGTGKEYCECDGCVDYKKQR